MKKLSVIATAVLCLISLTIGIAGATVIQKIEAQLRPDFTVVYEGKTQTFRNADGDKVYPILYEGSTYLPVRAISNMIDKEVTWYEKDKKIVIEDPPKVTVTDADKIVTDDTHSAAKPDTKPDKTPDTNVKITRDEAKRIALEKSGITEAQATKIEIELDDGTHYDVEIKQGRIEYEGEISASDGKILEWKVDIDD